MRRSVLIPLLAIPMTFSGCALVEENNSPPRPLGTVLRESATGFLHARNRERFTDAMRRNDVNDIRAASAALDRAVLEGRSPHDASLALVQDALSYEMRGRELTGDEREMMLARADAKYRLVLQLNPDMAKTSEDRDMLNTIGYHLADRGKTDEDFKIAEQLLRRAVSLWDREIRQSEGGPGSFNLRRRRAQEPLDSLAWALFKQKRYAEAQAYQKQVLDTMRAVNEDVYDAALTFHMAEILRAQNKNQAALRYYEIAMRMRPSVEVANQINESLRQLKLEPQKTTPTSREN